MSLQVIYPERRTTRPLRKRVITPNGFTTEPDGTEEILYEVLLDLGSLDEMARTAAGNKSQTSNDGPLRVRVLHRRREQA